MSARRPKSSTRTRRPMADELDYFEFFPLTIEVVFDAVEKVAALGPHPKAPRQLPGAYYVASILGNA